MSKSGSTATALAPFKERYALTAGSNIGELLRANLGGEEVKASDILDRIKIPSGGGTFWSVPTLDGDKPEKALEGIIVYTNRRRAYWPDRNATGVPPSCSSADCLTGHGDPGGDCLACPLGGKGAWGTATNADGTQGRGKACKEVRQLFLLVPGQELPFVVGAPPSSLGTLREYLGKELVIRRKVPYWACVTRLELEKAKNANGQEYSKVKPVFVEPLEADAVEAIKAYAAMLQPIFASTELQQDETVGD